MSTTAVDHPCERLPILTISPLRMYQTIPLASRNLVTRSVTSSTVPIASPVSMTSPTPYWSSRIMKMPLRKSLTRLCAPKPNATPTTPADARSGPSGRPNVDMTVSSARVKMTNVDVLLRTAPIVPARWALRVWSRPMAFARTRDARRGVWLTRRAARVRALSTTRSIARWSTHRSSIAPTNVPMMVSEGPISHHQLVTALELMDPALLSGGSGGRAAVDSVGFGNEASKSNDMPPSLPTVLHLPAPPP